MTNKLHTIDKIATWIERVLLIASGLLIFILTLLYTFERSLLGTSWMSWYTEVINILYTFMIMWGASNLARNNELMQVDLVSAKINRIGGKTSTIYNLIINGACFLISLMGVIYWAQYALMTNSKTAILKIPSRAVFFCGFVLGFVGLTLRHIIRFVMCCQKNQGEEEVSE